MNEDQLQLLLKQAEGQSLDWKRELPKCISDSPSEREAARGNMLKDIASLANGLLLTGGDSARLVYGVKDLGHSRKIFGIAGHLDDADLQAWAANAFHAPPKLAYEEHTSEGLVVAVITISRPLEPVIAKRTLGSLSEGQLWLRRGSQNVIAGPDELRELYSPQEPFRIGNLNDPVVLEMASAFRDAGDELVFKRYSDKDALLTRGWRLAHYPGTRREIIVVDHQGRIEHSGMLRLRPKSP